MWFYSTMFPPPHNINYNHHESEDHDQCDVPGTQQVLNKDKWEEKWEELLTSMHCFTTLCQQHERAHALNMVPSWLLSSLTTCNMHSHWPPPSGSILFLPCFHHMASSWVFSPLSSLDHVSLFYVPQMSVLYRFLLSVFLSSSTNSAQDTSPVSGFDYSTYADDFQSTTTHELLNPMSVTSQMSDKHPVPTYSEEPTLFCPNVILSLCSKVSEGHNITRGRTWRHSSSSHKSHQTPDADAAPPHTSTFPFTFFPALPLSRLLAELL